MAYKALYRTYRPQKFSEVVGQEVIVKTLQNSIKAGKISHAYLFNGPRGTGKTSVARVLAKALNCPNVKDLEPCGECEVCTEISSSTYPDVIEIDAASNNGVDEIRDIREKVKYLPSGAKWKIYIIDEVHMLTTNAFNALLKTLEEPPKHVIFVLATTDVHKVPATIISRCQRYDFKSLSVIEIKNKLAAVAKEENVQVDGETLMTIAESAEGALRDALSILEQVISYSNEVVTLDDVNNVTGNLSSDKLIELAVSFQEKEVNKALNTISELIYLGKEVRRIIAGLIQLYRDILIYKNIDTQEISKYVFEKEEFKLLAKALTTDKIFYYIDVLSDVQSKIRFSNSPQIFLEVAVIKMIHVTYEELSFIQRLKEIEEKLVGFEGNTTQSYQTPSLIKDEAVYEKIDTLDKTLASVRSELSKMDLPSVINKVSKLTNKDNENQDEVNLSNAEYYEELQLLKATVRSLQNQPVVNTSPPKEDVLNHAEKILNLERQIRILQNNNFEEACSMLEVQLRETKDEFSAARKEVARLKTIVDKPAPHGTTKVIGEINQDLVERLAKMEARIEELARGALAYYSLYLDQGSKKNRLKEVKGQMILFSDELVDVKDINKGRKSVEKEEELEEESDETYTEEADNQEEAEVESIDETKEESLEEETKKEESPKKEIKKDETNTIVVEKEEAIQTSQVVVNPPRQESFNSTLEILRLERKQQKALEEKNIKTEKPIVKETYSSNVIEPKKEIKVEVKNEIKEEFKTPLEILDDLPEETYSTNIEHSNRKKDDSNEVVWKSVDVEDNTEHKEVDFDTYNVKALEFILNTALSEKAKQDSIRVKELWKDLSKNVDSDDYGLVDLLKEATITAVGEKAILLVYPTYGTSNSVMGSKFKKRATTIICKTLLGKYEYLALPKEVWEEKRNEYSTQYKNKIKEPKLNEFDNERLVIQNNFEKEKEEESDVIEQLYEDIFK